MTGFLKRRWPMIVVACLLASLALNILLVHVSKSFYARELQVRLDPSGRQAVEWQTQKSATERSALDGVVYVGDSRIFMWTNPPGPTGMKVLNRGINGETTAQLMLRFDEDVLRERPAIVVIQSGGNDLRSIGLLPDRRKTIVRGCVDHLHQIVDELRSTGAKVVVTTVWPFGKPALEYRLVWSDDTYAARLEVNRELLAWKIDGVEVIDCDDLLSASGFLNPALSLDHLHLNAAGYDAVRSRIAAAVDRAAK